MSYQRASSKRRRTRALSRRPGEAAGPKGILRHDHWPNAAVCTSRYVVAAFRPLSSIDTRDTAIQRAPYTVRGAAYGECSRQAAEMGLLLARSGTWHFVFAYLALEMGAG